MKVSVALCTYNGGEYISDQLISIINQTRKPDEIIICDDRSSDQTISMVNSTLENSGIPYICQVNETNLGYVKNFEKATNLCTGDIILTSDQDDYWQADKIKIIENTFMNDQACMMVFSDAKLVDHQLNDLNLRLWDCVGFDPRKDSNIFMTLLNRPIVTGATMAFHRKMIGRITPFPKSWVHDGWIAINASIAGHVIPIDKQLILYRQHRNNAIGMKKLDIIKKMKLFTANVKHMDMIRTSKYEMYHDVLEYNTDINEQSDLAKRLDECICFWDCMKSLKDVSIIKGIQLIVHNLENQNYLNYYTGFRGAVRDIIDVLFRISSKAARAK